MFSDDSFFFTTDALFAFRSTIWKTCCVYSPTAATPSMRPASICGFNSIRLVQSAEFLSVTSRTKVSPCSRCSAQPFDLVMSRILGVSSLIPIPHETNAEQQPWKAFLEWTPTPFPQKIRDASMSSRVQRISN